MKKLFLILLFLLLSAFPARAARVDSALVDKIQKAYDSVKAFEADFEQTLTHKESGAVEKRKGKLLFKKPLLIRWVTEKPNAESLIINESEIWDYIPDEEIAYRYSPNLVKDSKSIIQVITGQAKLTTDFDLKQLSPQNGMTRLQLLPDEPTTQMVDAIIWVDPQKGLIRRARINDFYGNSNDVNLLSVRELNDAPKGSFNFKPPKDVEVEDRTKSGPQGKELFK